MSDKSEPQAFITCKCGKSAPMRQEQYQPRPFTFAVCFAPPPEWEMVRNRFYCPDCISRLEGSGG